MDHPLLRKIFWLRICIVILSPISMAIVLTKVSTNTARRISAQQPTLISVNESNMLQAGIVVFITYLYSLIGRPWVFHWLRAALMHIISTFVIIIGLKEKLQDVHSRHITSCHSLHPEPSGLSCQVRKLSAMLFILLGCLMNLELFMTFATRTGTKINKFRGGILFLLVIVITLKLACQNYRTAIGLSVTENYNKGVFVSIPSLIGIVVFRWMKRPSIVRLLEVFVFLGFMYPTSSPKACSIVKTRQVVCEICYGSQWMYMVMGVLILVDIGRTWKSRIWTMTGSR